MIQILSLSSSSLLRSTSVSEIPNIKNFINSWQINICLSFATWDDAVQAHLGQLLAMALTDAEADAAQQALMLCNPRHHLIPPESRGVARCWKDLGGRWTPNPDYAAGVVRRAQEMLTWV